MPMPLTGLHLLLTYRCPWECDHCFVWGGPENEGTMTAAQIRAVLDQAAELGIDQVYFEGGEPTLVYPILVGAAAHARDRGLTFGLVTDSFWAIAEEDARAWLEPLAELGIRDVSFSTYPFFGASPDAPVPESGGRRQSTVPASASGSAVGQQPAGHADVALLENAIRAAQSLGLPIVTLEVGAKAGLSHLGVACGEPDPIMYKGRAAVELAPAAARRPAEELTTCPYEALAAPERVHVGADGEVQVCQGISAGNAWRSSLRAVIDDYRPREMPVIRELLDGGPWELARRTGLSPLRQLYADECHLCYELRERLRSRFPHVLVPKACYRPGHLGVAQGGAAGADAASRPDARR